MLRAERSLEATFWASAPSGSASAPSSSVRAAAGPESEPATPIHRVFSPLPGTVTR